MGLLEDFSVAVIKSSFKALKMWNMIRGGVSYVGTSERRWDRLSIYVHSLGYPEYIYRLAQPSKKPVPLHAGLVVAADSISCFPKLCFARSLRLVFLSLNHQ